jgi:hypothetical protein
LQQAELNSRLKKLNKIDVNCSSGRVGLDERLARDTLFVGDFGLCRVLLMNNARGPWLILAPRCENLVELTDLEAADRALLVAEAALAAGFLKGACEGRQDQCRRARQRRAPAPFACRRAVHRRRRLARPGVGPWGSAALRGGGRAGADHGGEEGAAERSLLYGVNGERKTRRKQGSRDKSTGVIGGVWKSVMS